MTPKTIFSVLAILLAILSLIPTFHGAAVAFIVGGIISLGVAMLLPPVQ